MKLTKRNFLKMPVGHYLVSNTFSHFPHPTFAETIDGTENQWQRILAVGAMAVSAWYSRRWMILTSGWKSKRSL